MLSGRAVLIYLELSAARALGTAAPPLSDGPQFRSTSFRGALVLEGITPSRFSGIFAAARSRGKELKETTHDEVNEMLTREASINRKSAPAPDIFVVRFINPVTYSSCERPSVVGWAR